VSDAAPIIGYHASHEQFAPGELLRLARRAEAAGFSGGMCSDHFHPWTETQGESGFAWSWLGAALEATELSFGTVCAPGQRYHPAIIAQAAATLGSMYPDRFWIAVGSGQALNEAITGDRWPPKAERNARLRECVDIMRALWAGETVTHRGLVTLEEATLYTRPAEPPPVFIAAITPDTARWAGEWADGLITVAQPHDTLRQVIDAFHEGGGADKPLALQVQLAYHPDEETARRQAWEQWRMSVLASPVLSDLRSPAQFDAAIEPVREDDLDDTIRISADPAQHTAWLREYLDLGFDRLYLHQVTPDQDRFVETFGERVLPDLSVAGVR
jgi:coenzyme F420-dependent glucose-6-phosphate dehydrogenase